MGELRYAWRDVFAADSVCACGSRYSRCEVWGPIRAAARIDRGEAERLVRFDDRLLLTRRFPHLAVAARRSGAEAEFGRYAAAVRRLYGAIEEQTGARVIVDTSKAPTYAYALVRAAPIDLHVVHLIRDSRGTAYSRVRRGQGIVAASLLWNAWNMLAERSAPVGRYLRIRYEDLVAEPETTVRSILELVDEPSHQLPFLDDRHAFLSQTHSVAGNERRSSSGAVAFELDGEWTTSMGTPRKTLVTALTWPFLRRYGYLPHPRSAPERDLSPSAGSSR